MTGGKRTHSVYIFLILTSLLPGTVLAQESMKSMLSLDEIVRKLSDRSQERAVALSNYTGRRVYNLVYRGFPGNRDASLTVLARFTAPARKEFEVISQSGSKFLINRVIKKLLDGEKEALDDTARRQTALTQDNYRFAFSAFEQSPAGSYYVLTVEPKIDNKFLYRGKIWIDANDFAVARIEAEPAKKPSIWIRHTKIRHVYAKIGEFWLPSQNTSITNVLLGGTATLTIQYDDYRIESVQMANPTTSQIGINR